MKKGQAIAADIPAQNRSSWLDWRYFAVLALVFAVLFALTTPDVSRSIYTVPDTSLATEGDWRNIQLDRYDRRSAIFARNKGAVLTADLGATRTIETADLRLYSYGDPTNRVTISAGGQSQTLTYGALKGVNRYAVTFSPAVTADTVRITVNALEQPAFLVDSVTVSEPRFDIARLLHRAVLGPILAAALWVATALTIAPTTSSGRIYTSIDGMRGIGVLLVLCLHSTGYAGLPQFDGQPFLANLAKHGHFGVEVFYLVSAYTLTFSLFSAVRRKQPNLIGTFWSRRVNRIVPTLMVVVLAAFLLRGVISSAWPAAPDVPGVIWRYATMTYIFDRDVLRAALGHSVLWSISTEFQFYLLMPLLMLPLVRLLSTEASRNVLFFHAALLTVGSILATAWTRTLMAEKSWMSYTLFYHFDAFMIGIAIALVVLAQRRAREVAAPPDDAALAPLPTPSGEAPVEMPPKSTVWQRMGPEFIAIGALGGMVILIALATSGGIVFEAIGVTQAMRPERLFVLLVCAAVVYVAEWAERQGATLGALKALRTIGLLSFIIYLVHVPALQMVGKIPLPGAFGSESDRYLATLALGLVLSLAVSVIIHRVIEHPSLKLNALAIRRPAYRIATSVFVLVIAGSLLSYLGSS